jgi:hypothetical protein
MLVGYKSAPLLALPDPLDVAGTILELRVDAFVLFGLVPIHHDHRGHGLLLLHDILDVLRHVTALLDHQIRYLLVLIEVVTKQAHPNTSEVSKVVILGW